MRKQFSLVLLFALLGTACSNPILGANPSKGIYFSLDEKKKCNKYQVDSGDIPTSEPVPNEPDPGKVLMPVKKGQLVPFSGTLASPKAVADIIAQIKSIDERIKVETEHARKDQEIKDNYVIENLKAEKERLEREKEIMVTSRDEQIKILTQELAKTSNPNQGMWFALGVGLGVISTTVVSVAVATAIK